MRYIVQALLAFLKRCRTRMALLGTSSYLTYGPDLHVGKGSRLWAPRWLRIGRGVYIGKDVNIEANCEIGDYSLIANRVGIVGRNDHDFKQLGVPVRFARWIGQKSFVSPHIDTGVVIGSDVWVGYGATLLTGVTVGRGAIVAAGALVVSDVEPYSIVGGAPARVIGRRFDDPAVIAQHEHAIDKGCFQFSERGLDYSVIRPFMNGEAEFK